LSRLYIGGDSFCKYRNQPTDWPRRLADQLGLELHGRGYEGDTWWYTRRELIQYLTGDLSQDTQLFVICHTDPHRILNGQHRLTQGLSDETDRVREVYYKYIHDSEIHNWTAKQWYQELNTVLAGRPVIHLQCFNSTRGYFDILQGLKFTAALTEISVTEPGADRAVFMSDARRNHFSTENNLKLADFVLGHYRAVGASDMEIAEPFVHYK